MTRARKKSQSTGLTAAAARRLQAFGPAPILNGESVEAYNDLFEAIFDFVDPCDAIEEMWVNDLANYSWEGNRMRRLKLTLINAEARRRLVSALEDALEDDAEHASQDDEDNAADEDAEDGSNADDDQADCDPAVDVEKLVEDWSTGESRAVSQVQSLLQSTGLSVDGILAEILAEHIDFVDRVDRLIALAEARRGAVLRELQRHRGLLGGPGQRVAQIEHAANGGGNMQLDQRKRSPCPAPQK